MTNEDVTVTCIHCGINRPPQDTGPCHNCGRIGRHINVVFNEVMTLNDSIIISKTREYYVKRPKLTGALIAIWLSSSITGYVIGGTLGCVLGTLIGAIAFVLPPSTTKVKETERF